MFDPITLGHLDVIRRGRLLFEHLVVGIGVNPNKAALFSIDERVELARRVVAPFDNVSVESFEELTVQFVRRIGARVILRGVRTLSDMEYEFGMSLTNYRLDPSIETVFLMADGEYSHVSSSLIKQVVQYGGAEALRSIRPPRGRRADPGQDAADPASGPGAGRNPRHDNRTGRRKCRLTIDRPSIGRYGASSDQIRVSSPLGITCGAAPQAEPLAGREPDPVVRRRRAGD